MGYFNTDNRVWLTQNNLKEMQEQVEKVMEYVNAQKNYNHSNQDAQRNGFMCELIARKLLREPLELAVGIDPGYDIAHQPTDSKTGALLPEVYIDVKACRIYDRWTDHTKQFHDLRIHRPKMSLPPDFVYVFISATDDPQTFVVEGACTQGELLKGLNAQKEYATRFDFMNPDLPQYYEKGSFYRGIAFDNNVIVVPNKWLPWQGILGMHLCIKRVR